MLSRSLTSCLIKPLTNDRVSQINSICCLKGRVHSERHALLGAGYQGIWSLRITTPFPRTRGGSCRF